MSYFFVDGYRDGTNQPLYLQAQDEQQALNRARSMGMQPTGVRPAKEMDGESLDGFPWWVVAFQTSGIISLMLSDSSRPRNYFAPIMLAYLTINIVHVSMRTHLRKSATVVKKLEAELAELRTIVMSLRKAPGGDVPAYTPEPDELIR